MSHAIQQRIETIRSRIARARLATGVCWAATLVLTVAIVLGLTDYLLRYVDPGLRVLATVALVMTAGWALVRFVWPVMRRPVTSLGVAERIEETFPQLQDRLASSLGFLGQSENDPTAGSAELRRAVIADTAVQVEELPLESAIDRQPVRRATKSLAVVVAMLLIALAVDATSVGIAARRLVAPLGTTEWPRQHRLAFRELPKQLAVGETFEAELVDQQGQPPNDVTVHYRFRDDRGTDLDSQPAERIGDVLVARRDDVRRTFEVRATGGDDYTMPWHQVEVVEPPQIASIQITAHPPSYTGLPSTRAEKHLQVLAGTKLELVATTDDDVRAARVRFGSRDSISAERQDSADADLATTFRIPPDQWVAEETDTYWVELEDRRGLVGASDRWHLRAETDPPPDISWRQPETDLFVLPEAVVRVSLSVSDNLQIKAVHLVYLRSDQSEQGEQSIQLYAGPEQATLVDAAGESRIVDYEWQLAPLELNPGVTLSINGHATDYRPGLGQTPSPRRIVIITRDELDQRIADRQNQIAQRLEQALALERTTREQVRRVEIQARDVGQLEDADRGALQSARLSQRRVESQLVDPTEGLPAEIAGLVAELAANGLANSELEDEMQNLSAALERLGAGSLPAIEQQLTAASKSLESEPTSLAEVSPALASAGARQEEVIRTLEELLGNLSQWAGYQRFAREVAQLRKQQFELRDRTGQEIGLAPPTGNRARGQWQADVDKMAEAQRDLSQRFEKLRQDMQQTADELGEEDAEAAATLHDAVDQAQQLGISAELREAINNFQQQRIGRATANQQQAADHLEQLLNTLRNRREQQLDRLVAQLKEAERDLAALREQLAGFREDIEQAQEQPESENKQRELERLRRQSDDVQEDIERMARRLQRLQADLAGRSAQRAAENLAQRGEGGQGQPGQRAESPPSGDQARQAEQDLAEAAQQLAEARQQAEQDLAQQQMARFETAIRAVVDGQRRVLEDTQQFDDLRRATGELTFGQLRTVLQLADQQQLLADEVSDFGDVLGSMGVFRLALGEASADMRRAAELLNEKRVDEPTQEAEQQALARLEQIAKSLERDPTPPENNQGGGGGGGGQGGQQGPQLQLAEIKLLRMLQVDLHERTAALREKASRDDLPEDGTLAESARQLSAEQGRLAELVVDILSRDNGDGQQDEAEAADQPDEDQELRDLLEQLDEQL